MYSEGGLTKPKLLLFDVYNTFLDMNQIERRVNQILDSKRGYVLWFELFMQHIFVDNNTSPFHNFSSIADATFRMTCRMLEREEKDHYIKEILELMKHLPVCEGVQEAFSDLLEQGYRIAALTNSPQNIVIERMERTGLISYFEDVISAEQLKNYKPAKQVYERAAEKFKLNANEILLVSTHGWDIAGAANAGMKTAYIEQIKQMLYPLAPTPDFICKSISHLADQLKTLFTTNVHTD